VISLYVYALLAGAPVGGLVGGWLADIGGAGLAFAISGAFGLAAVLLSFLWLRKEPIPEAAIHDLSPEGVPG
jgi:predicted MFS family arabinose efflux permease